MSYQDIKHEAERDSKELKELHDKFDYIYDKEKMADKLPTEWYDPEEIDKEDDPDVTTDFTDSQEDYLYKRYKGQQFEVKTKLKDHQAIIS